MRGSSKFQVPSSKFQDERGKRKGERGKGNGEWERGKGKGERRFYDLRVTFYGRSKALGGVFAVRHCTLWVFPAVTRNEAIST